ncbi:hypothetical protein N7510_008555 [Penicillium lagena]|uniref:uncharacterized protein n=1 Tax=Penicillium lagena TaxID=94218 RepID=UPI00254230E3|nr:uncharacterized protein N7510_008555 [Penicillium lagena]KAJ5605774.1 hypothetical protein N7510_008555 [Penicillium lagena]
MESGPAIESQKSSPQTDSPNDTDKEDLELKPQQSNSYHLPLWRKCLILFTVSWMTLAVTFSSTSLLPATPEIASDFSTTTEILNVTNAGVLIAMGFSSFIWGPISNIFGRRNAYNVAILVLCGSSAGTAAAINLHMFIGMRLIGGFTGTFFMVAGQTILADIFEPVSPCIGGIIVTFAHWRVIYWLQFAMTCLGLILSLLLVPELRTLKSTEGLTKRERLLAVLHQFNPLRIFLMSDIPLTRSQNLTCGLLSTFQYGLLTSARSIFNPRFHLTTPLVSGLFYLAPGIGFLLGSVIGGRLSDRAVRRWIRKRNGVRLPQDRLNSGLGTLFGVLPAAILIYGWSLQEKKGGMPLPIISAFFAGVGLLGAFNGLNTYSAGECCI